MKVRILSTSNYGGGAAIAASRLNKSIYYKGVQFKSEMQVANYKADINNIIKPNSNLLSGWYLTRRYIGRLIQKLQKSNNRVLHSSSLIPSRIHEDINNCDADIVNLHWVQGEFISIKSISLIKKPIVWTFHDLWPFLGTEHYPSDYSDRRYVEGYLKKNRLAYEKGLDLDLISWRLKKYYFKNPIQIVCKSNWLGECVRNSSLMSSWPVEIIPNPVPLDIYKPWPKKIARNLFNLPQEKNLILFGAIGGTDDPRKGWKFLKEALKQLGRRHNNMQAVVFGQHEPKRKPDVGMPLTYLGEFHDDQTLALLYSAADVMVVPSIMENLPQSATEAQSCGTPVVAFNCSGLVDVVENLVTGYLARPFESDDLSKGIEWVLTSKDYKNISLKSRKRAQNLWSEEIIISKYEKIYQKVLNKNNLRI